MDDWDTKEKEKEMLKDLVKSKTNPKKKEWTLQLCI